jgi:hypothetical protein
MLDSPEWLAVTAQAVDNGPYVSLQDICIGIPRLLERTDRLAQTDNVQGEINLLIEDSEQLANRAFDWMATFERNGPRYDGVSLKTFDDFLTICADRVFDPVFYFHYPGADHCYLFYWMSMLFLEGNTSRLLSTHRQLDVNQMMIWNRRFRGYANSICCSVPYSHWPTNGYTARLGSLIPLMVARRYYHMRHPAKKIEETWCEKVLIGRSVPKLYEATNHFREDDKFDKRFMSVQSIVREGISDIDDTSNPDKEKYKPESRSGDAQPEPHILTSVELPFGQKRLNVIREDNIHDERILRIAKSQTAVHHDKGLPPTVSEIGPDAEEITIPELSRPEYMIDGRRTFPVAGGNDTASRRPLTDNSFSSLISHSPLSEDTEVSMPRIPLHDGNHRGDQGHVDDISSSLISQVNVETPESFLSSGHEKIGMTRSPPVEEEMKPTRRPITQRCKSYEESDETMLETFQGTWDKKATTHSKNTETSFHFPLSLPLLIDSILQRVPLPFSDPPVPEGKVRARWIRVRCFRFPVTSYETKITLARRRTLFRRLC